VRDSTKLSQAAFWYKVYIAAAAATAEQAFEVSLLDSALGLLDSSLLDALPAVWSATGQTSKDAFDAEQMRNATCLCAAAETLLVGTPRYNPATYASANCSGRGTELCAHACMLSRCWCPSSNARPWLAGLLCVLCAADVTQLGDRAWDIDGNATYSYSMSPSQAECDATVANLTSHLSSYNSTILSLLSSQRLGDLRTTGKFAQRLRVANNIRRFLSSKYPELVAAVFVNPTGADTSDPVSASLDALANLFVESSQFVVTGAPANLALYRRRLTGVRAAGGCHEKRQSLGPVDMHGIELNVQGAVMQGRQQLRLL
jgi:hypothetical protein